MGAAACLLLAFGPPLLVAGFGGSPVLVQRSKPGQVCTKCLASSAPPSGTDAGYVPRQGRRRRASESRSDQRSQSRALPRKPRDGGAPAVPGRRRIEGVVSAAWVQAFEGLRQKAVRAADDYERTFHICVQANRPRECFSTLRFMAKDGIPRPMSYYDTTIQLAKLLGDDESVVDTYLLWEKREEVDATCAKTRSLVKCAMDACVRLGKGGRAARLYDLSQSLSPRLDRDWAAASALRACSRAGLYKEGRRFARMVLGMGEEERSTMEGRGAAVDLSLANKALKVLAKTKDNSAEAWEALPLMGSLGLTPDETSYEAATEGLVRAGRLDEALEGTLLRTPSSRLSPALLALLIESCCRSGRLRDAMRVYEVSKGLRYGVLCLPTLFITASREGGEEAWPTLCQDLTLSNDPLPVTTFHASLCNLSKVGKKEMAEALVAAWKDAGGEMTALTYYALVAACEKASDWERLLYWYEGMKAAGHEPDEGRLGMALKACEYLGLWEAGLQLLSEMLQAKGEGIDSRVFKRVFLLLGREGRGDEAFQLIDELTQRGFRLEVICLEAVITAYARMGNKDEALSLLARFIREGVALSRGAFTSAISACRECKDANSALMVYKLAQKYSVDPPSSATRSALLGVLLSADRMPDAIDLVAEEEACWQQRGEGPITEMLADVVAVYVHQGRFDRVVEVLRGAWKREGSFPAASYHTANQGLQACSKVGDPELALEIMKMLEEHGHKLDVVMWGCLLNAYAVKEQWREAVDLLREMEQSDTRPKPNVVCYTAALAACQRAGEWRVALNLLLRMLQDGPIPDVPAFNALISACANAGEGHMALKVFQAMQKAGLPPNEITYATAVVACWKSNQWRRAVEMLNMMKAAGFTPNMITVSLVIEVCDNNRQHELSTNIFEAAVVGHIRSECYDPRLESAGMVVDLHGYSKAVARAALRAGLKRLGQMYVAMGRDPSIVKNFVFITGVGKHSTLPFEPVLRPAMRDMLQNDFNPPLPCHFVEGNAGRLEVRAPDLVRWLDEQTRHVKHVPAELKAGVLKYKSAEELRAEFEEVKGKAASCDQ